MAHRYLPSDVTSDIHQIIAKAMHARHVTDGRPLILTRVEMERAAEAEFEYDLLDDGSILFQPVKECLTN